MQAFRQGLRWLLVASTVLMKTIVPIDVGALEHVQEHGFRCLLDRTAVCMPGYRSGMRGVAVAMSGTPTPLCATGISGQSGKYGQSG